MKKYDITATVKLYDFCMPDDFDPENNDGGDILVALDMYVDEKTYQTGWRTFEETMKVSGDWVGATYKVVQ
jgi:hypothetical protein